ncbi:MAG: ABC transporter permease [Gemmatimonadaceae bacterium]
MSLSTRIFSVLEGVTIAIDALRANRVRAALTILGVAVGVFVVVLISGAIHGINQSVAADFEKAGPSTFYVSRYPITFEACDGTDDTCKWLRNPPITKEEIQTLSRLPGIATVAARANDQGPVTYRQQNIPSPSITAYTANWTEVDGSDISPGRTFTTAENASGAQVVLINDDMAKALFGEVDPIGKQISIKGNPFQVIGVYHYIASFLSGGKGAKAIVPLEAAFRHLGTGQRGIQLTVKPAAGVERDDAIDAVTAALRGQRGLKPGADNTFAIITQDKLFETYNKIFGMFFIVMIALSAVGTLVGGVGVIAIMMISVTERTREIGVRKALGATRKTILWQFLVEAVTLTGIGAFVGMFVGWIGTLALRAFTPLAASIPLWSIGTAVGASVVTGIVFGMMPALKASRLDPVEALRYE